MSDPAAPGDAAIICQDLTRHYGSLHALEGLTLSVPYGSVFGFLGRNGAGKTTAIRMLTGLAHPTRGRAWVAGVETTNADSAARRMFGYLPQSPAFYNWMTPLEYLSYCGRLFGLPTAQIAQRSAEMLDLVDLQAAARRRIGGFSGGMIQRLGIAQALVHSPPVLFLDEPTSALDPAGRYEVLDLIARLRGQVTVFLSSHILTDIERVCDRVAIVRQGELALVAEREELLARYAVSAVDLAVESAQAGALSAFGLLLQELPWVAGVDAQLSHLHVRVHGAEGAAAGKQALLPLALAHGLVLERYEWVRPTLEEIFLQVSA